MRPRDRFVRRLMGSLAAAVLTSLLVAALAPVPGVFAQAEPDQFTILSPEGRRPLPVQTTAGQVVAPLDALAAAFQFSVREDAAARGITATYKGKSIVMTVDQDLASVDGRLVSLGAPVMRDGRRVLVPIDFLSRALAPVYDRRIEVRRGSALIVLGDVRAPRVAAHAEDVGGQARVTIEVTPPTPHTISRDASRVVIRFDADALDVAISDPIVPGFIEGIRTVDPGASLAVSLGPRTSSFKSSDLPGARGGARIVLELGPAGAADATAPAAAPSTAPDAATVPPSPSFSVPSGWRTIVIDPGHGGDDAGVKGGAGVLEKDVTMSIARRLKGLIEGALGLRVVLTRDGDRSVSLDERCAVANSNKAELFLSLHANASLRSTAKGAAVYVLDLDAAGVRSRVGGGSPAVLPTAGGGVRPIEFVAWEMAQAGHVTRSTALADAITGAFVGRVALEPTSAHPGPLRVLLGANMPAVVVEMGFLSNRDEEALLRSDGYQATVAQALLDGLVRFRGQAAVENGTDGETPPEKRQIP